MNKKQFLNTYKKIDSMDKSKNQNIDKNPIYRSEQDERLIKDFHYAIFQKNLHNTKKNEALKGLLEKEDWDEKDTEKLLHSLR
jgi:hypothetical protein